MIALIFALVILVPLLTVPFAFIAMLLLGAAHSVNPIIPAFGFVETWLLSMIFSLLSGSGAAARSK